MCMHIILSVLVTACAWAGAPLLEILEAGEWSSPAFMKYMDLARLARDVVVQAHCDESDGEVDDELIAASAA